MTISWDRATVCTGVVEYGLTTSLGRAAPSSAATNQHRVTIEGLAAGQTYWYRIRTSDGYVSSMRTFRTAVAPGVPFTFAMIGDTRSNTNAHGALIRRILPFKPLWYGNVGDLVFNGTVRAQWGEFCEVERALLGYSAFMPAVGNHDIPEDPNCLYWSLFALPPNPAAGRYYSFDSGSMHVVVLDTEMDLMGAQRNWLEKDLQKAAANQAITWTIAYFHRPPYSSGSHGSQFDVRAAWCALFEKYGVDLVFAGHDHCYERTKPINGVTYVVTGGGGAPLYAVTGSWFTAVAEGCFEVVIVDVETSRLRYRALREDGVVIDTFVVTNNAAIQPSTSSRVIRPADFDGDGRDDLAVYNPSDGRWYIQRLTDPAHALAWALPWGFAGALPVPADYDGDGHADLAVYFPPTGAWYVYSLALNKTLAWDFRWGRDGAVPVPGDYDGDGAAEPGVYVPASGRWYAIRLTGAKVVLWDRPWGGAGMMPVPGDYDGDGHDDLGVFIPSDGRWYIQRVDDPVHALAWAYPWGYTGVMPVPGDYDDDGKNDLAVYDPVRHTWFATTMTGAAIMWNRPWGFDGASPVPADYNGDGRTDPGVYSSQNAWYIYSLGVTGGVLSWNRHWGFPGGIAIGGIY